MNSLTLNSKEYQITCTQIYVKLKNDGLNRRDALKTSSIHRFIKQYDGTKVVTDKERQIWILNKAISGEFKDWPIRTDKMKCIREQKHLQTTKRRLLKNKKARKRSSIINREERLKKYHSYLLTPKWRTISQTVIKRDGNKCTKCGSTKILHAHHKTYKNIFNELNHLEDLITLCKECHKVIHKKK